MQNESSPHPVDPVDLPIADRFASAVLDHGEEEVVTRAIALLAGVNAGREFLLVAGGRHARGVLEGAPPLYWPELWGARALLYVWNDTAIEAVTAGLGNEAWRVREMSARVVSERALDLAPQLVELTADEVPRVRAAALRALATVGSVDHTATIVALVRDPDKDVRRAAQQSRDALAARVGRPPRPETGVEPRPATDSATTEPSAGAGASETLPPDDHTPGSSNGVTG